MLYGLNLYSAVCQLYLHKIRRGRRKQERCFQRPWGWWGEDGQLASALSLLLLPLWAPVSEPIRVPSLYPAQWGQEGPFQQDPRLQEPHLFKHVTGVCQTPGQGHGHTETPAESGGSPRLPEHSGLGPSDNIHSQLLEPQYYYRLNKC